MLSEAWNGCAGVLCRVLYHTPPPFREQSRTRRICHKSRGRSARCQRRRGGAHAAVVIAAPLHTVDAGGERRRHRRRCRGQRGGATPGARVAAEQFDVFAVLSNALHLPARRASAHGKASRRDVLWGWRRGRRRRRQCPCHRSLAWQLRLLPMRCAHTHRGLCGAAALVLIPCARRRQSGADEPQS